MTNIEAAVDPYVDTPDPDLADVQQEQSDALLVVPVRPVGPVPVQQLPARCGAAFPQPLSTTFAHVLGADPKRRRVVLVAAVAWEYSRTSSAGSGAPIPANVPLELQHCDTIYARVPTSTGTLAVIAETWAE